MRNEAIRLCRTLLRRGSVSAALFVAMAATGTAAFATPSHLAAFRRKYPQAHAIVSCRLCHGQSNRLNDYGADYRDAGHDFAGIEERDSDGDTFLNLREIQADTFPGDRESVPPQPVSIRKRSSCP